MAAATEWRDKDYYKILGVSETATEVDIRRAYRQLARAAHPDANPRDAGAEKRFKEISAAFDVLGNPDKRKEYDQLRRKKRSAPVGGRPGGGFRVHVNNVDVQDLSGFGSSRSIFDEMFTAQRAHQSNRPYAQTGQDLSAEMSIPFVDAVFGTSKTVELAAQAVCSTCGGSGVAPLGTGPTICGACRGQGRVAGSRTVKVRIPPGIEDGQTVRLREHGEPGLKGGRPGDLYVTVEVEPHPDFGRIGDNLTLTVPVTFPEAVMGATVPVPMLDGSTVTVRIPPGTPAGRVLRVPGKGIQKPSSVGDLLLTIDIEVPTEITADELSKIRALADAFEHRRPRAHWEART